MCTDRQSKPPLSIVITLKNKVSRSYHGHSEQLIHLTMCFRAAAGALVSQLARDCKRKGYGGHISKLVPLGGNFRNAFINPILEILECLNLLL